MINTVALRMAFLSVYIGHNSINGLADGLLSDGISFLLETVLPVLTSNRLLLVGAILLAIALVVEILNGLLDMVVYTAVIGGVGLLLIGGFMYIF